MVAVSFRALLHHPKKFAAVRRRSHPPKDLDHIIGLGTLHAR
jgi:hypothetical protein